MRWLDNRIPPPVILLICLVLMRLLSEIPSSISIGFAQDFILPAILLILGLGLMLAGVIAFRKAQTTVNPLSPNSASALVEAGVYRITRNPMYLGMALITIAWAFYLSNPWSLIGVVGFVVFINHYQIKPEETAMSALFGDQYVVYKQKVRRWI